MYVWRSYRFRLKPTKAQEELLTRYNRCTRMAWNSVLDLQKKRIETRNFYSEEETDSLLQRWSSESPLLENINLQPLRITLRHQHKALQNFLRGKKNFPHPKLIEKGGKFQFTSGIKIYDGEFFLPLIGKLKFTQHRPMNGEVKRVTIMIRGGKWEVSFLLYTERPDPIAPSDKKLLWESI